MRELLSAPLHVPAAVNTIGRGLWLYLDLVTIADARGCISRTLESLGKDVGVSSDRAHLWLARLVRVGLVSVHDSSEHLVIQLRFWSGNDPVEGSSGSNKSGQQARSHKEVPVSSSKHPAAAAAAIGLEDGGPGEGGSQLLDEVLRVLGETDADEFRELLGQFPPTVVLRALVRVKTTPARQIRKSKAALFRYLLGKFANERRLDA